MQVVAGGLLGLAITAIACNHGLQMSSMKLEKLLHSIAATIRRIKIIDSYHHICLLLCSEFPFKTLYTVK
ncbi:hypothetical protein A4A49_02143 [Nicotiana attenuata]|uniref:Uncharacterized protein n=1 Tax=Nicotiana attenuata TaxID=49451 RepID=A0A314LCC5_NICAT|nr:hypothetical protein A4A49_02143 [Nicotiana attenuata]